MSASAQILLQRRGIVKDRGRRPRPFSRDPLAALIQRNGKERERRYLAGLREAGSEVIE